MRAITDLFPNIGLDKSKFYSQCISLSLSLSLSLPLPFPISPSFLMFGYTAFLSDPVKRKNFFLEYAQKSGFSPYVPDNWYTQQKARIMSIKVEEIWKRERDQRIGKGGLTVKIRAHLKSSRITTIH
jgi:hypothetical protein